METFWTLWAGRRPVARWSFIWPCLSALCSDSCGCRALPKPGEGSGCVRHLALPGRSLSSSGRAGRPALPHGQRSLPPLQQPLEAADSGLESAPASLHPCSPDRPAQHTPASVQSRWGGPRTAAIPHPLRILLLNGYNSCKSKGAQGAHFMRVASALSAQLSAKEAPTWRPCCCAIVLKTTTQMCSGLIRSQSGLAISSSLLSTKLCHTWIFHIT